MPADTSVHLACCGIGLPFACRMNSKYTEPSACLPFAWLHAVPNPSPPMVWFQVLPTEVKVPLSCRPMMLSFGCCGLDMIEYGMMLTTPVFLVSVKLFAP